MMLESLEKCLQAKIASRADLVQLRGQTRKMTTCTVKNGVVENFSNVSLNGVGVRFLVAGKSWGFSSTNMFDPKSVEQTLQNALKLAKASSKLKRQGTTLPPVRAVVADESIPVKKPLQNLSTENIVKIPYEACKGAKAVGKNVADVKATYISIEDDRYFLSSEGSRIHQSSTRVMLFVDVLARRIGLLCPASENLGHTGGLELFDRTSPYSLGKAVAEEAVRLLGAKSPPSGKFQVVIHPTLCATLLHEAVGHPLEADLAMSGGGFGSHIGELASSRLVTIYDDGCVPGGLGYFAYDDEGVECRRTDLIEKGVLRTFMHDKLRAIQFGDRLEGEYTTTSALCEKGAEGTVARCEGGVLLLDVPSKLSAENTLDIRQNAIVVYGPSPENMIPPVSWQSVEETIQDYLREIDDELQRGELKDLLKNLK